MTRLNRRRLLLTASAAASFPSFGASASLDCGASEGSQLDVAIIGAGLSGLAAARDLAAAGVNRVAVLEARDHVGGRTVNQTIAGVKVEAGGQWAGPGQTALLTLADELGVATYPTRTRGRSLAKIAGFNVKVSEAEFFARNRSTLAAFEDFDTLAAKVRVDAPWDGPQANEWDSTSVGAWIRKQRRGRRAYFSAAADALSSLNGDLEMSFLDFLWSIAAAGGMKPLNDFRGGAQDRRFAGGAQEIAIRMAAALDGKVWRAAPVDEIAISENGAAVRFGDTVLTARKVIIALSPADARRIKFTPELPAKRHTLQSVWEVSSGFKAHMAYRTPFWRAQDLSGISVGADLVEATFDNTPEPGSENPNGVGVLMMFLDRNKIPGDQSARRDAVVKILRNRFGRKAGDPLDYVEMDWRAQQWSTGCTSPQPPGIISAYGSALRQPIGPIHWAGTETAGQWRGYMDGAVRAGQRAAREVIASI